MGQVTEPRPKGNVEGAREKENWVATSVLNEITTKLSSKLLFDEVLHKRRTKRVFSPVSLQDVCIFVHHVFSPCNHGSGALKGLMKKPIVSAGALHPIDIIIVAGEDVSEPILFNDKNMVFVTLPVDDSSAFCVEVDAAKSIQPLADGHLLLFVADKRRVSRMYENSSSLFWRDAGAALQACAMGAYAYNYGFCPLGITGEKMMKALGTPHDDFVAVGVAIIGAS